MSSSAADNGSAAYTSSNMNTNGAQRAPPETPDSERASFHSARSIPAPKVVQVSNQLENVLDSGLEPLDQDGTPMAMQTEPKTPRNTTPQGFKRHTSGENEPPARRGTWFGRLLGHLPDWLQEALSTSRAWKNWFRSMVAALAMIIMMVAKKSKSAGRRALTGSGCYVRGRQLLRLLVLPDDHTEYDDDDLLPRAVHRGCWHAARLGMGVCCHGGRH